jgi:hypothetical protein
VCPGSGANGDVDADGVCDDVDVCLGFNDALDADGDGVPNGCDACPADALDDSDSDGSCDSVDLCPGSDDDLDADGDGTPDGCDLCPLDAADDSDGDGVCDSDDVCAGSDDDLDVDGDGVPNGCDACPVDALDDSDSDGLCDSVDACPGFDDALDTDGDGIADGCDVCPDTSLNAADIYGDCAVDCELVETFDDNSAGWVLGNDWQIGAATAGCNDPSVDADGVAGGGVAGVELGGCAPTVIHPTYYLTSPVFYPFAYDTLQLDFARWLRSDYTPYMQSVVQVFDGSSWQTVWSTGGPPGVYDTAWTDQSFDLSPYLGSSMQVRFGFSIGSNSVFSVGSWNLDNVAICGVLSNSPGGIPQ